jgi:branched-subunit amino acid transport protein
MPIWFLSGVLGVTTYGERILFLLGKRWVLPSRIEKALRLVPPIVLAAIVAPALFVGAPGVGFPSMWRLPGQLLRLWLCGASRCCRR